MKRVVLETGGNASNIARFEIKLVFARGAESEHPGLRFRDAVSVDRVVALPLLVAGKEWDGRGRDAVDG